MTALLDDVAVRPLPARAAGAFLTGSAVLFLAFDSVIKLVHVQPVTEAMAHLGVPDALAVPIGAIEAACLALYALPRTAPLGAVLLTGFLGGAVLSHLRIGDPLPSHTLFPLYVGAFVWGGLLLRRPELAALLGLRR